MPEVQLIGHFALVSSYATSVKFKDGSKWLALLEIRPELVKMIPDKHYPDHRRFDHPNIKIDPRLKCVKRIILRSRRLHTNNRNDARMYKRLCDEWANLAEHFEKLWPCHFLCKGYPPLEE